MKKYSAPSIEVEEFDSEDIIRTSNGFLDEETEGIIEAGGDAIVFD